MKPYLTKHDAVVGLHESGFTEDFELFGNDLLWIQGKIFLRPKDFSITEVHYFPELSGKETIIFGVYSHRFSTGGILFNHFKTYTDKLPPVISRKLILMDSNHFNLE